MSFKPMLAGAAPEDLSTLRYPVLVSRKYDGIRCVKLGGKALTRKLKPIRNDYIRNWIESRLPDGIDGEICLPDLTAPFREVSSAVMGKKGQPDFRFVAFDQQHALTPPFEIRLDFLKAAVQGNTPQLTLAPQYLIHSKLHLLLMHEQFLAEGFEGTMIRDPNGPYKFGRSTTKEGYLLKLKLWEDEEATVIGVEEEMANTNEATTDALGRTKRSSAQEGKVGKGRLGALWCRFEDGAEFTVSGFTDAEKEQIWADVEGTIGRVVTIKHQPAPGGRKPGESPRFPGFKGFRLD